MRRAREKALLSGVSMLRWQKDNFRVNLLSEYSAFFPLSNKISG